MTDIMTREMFEKAWYHADAPTILAQYDAWRAALAAAERERDALRDACRRLYLAGRWRRDGFKSEQDAAEWEAFRDAAAIQPGTATDAGVSG